MELTLKKILESLNLEARSNPELNPKQTWESFVKDLLTKVNYENLYVSFRESIYTTDINRKNEYETPTGVYAYPVMSYFASKEDMLKSPEKYFRGEFPYQNRQPYMLFMDIKDTSKILSEETPKEKLDEYVKKIDNIYGKKQPVHMYCELFLNNKYQSQYSITPYHDTHRFWLFLYSIAPYINKGGSKQTTITNICNAIGVDGFVDKTGDGYIHPAEPKQAVFFKVKNIADVYVYQKETTKDYKIVYTNDKKHYFYNRFGEDITLMIDAKTKKPIKELPVKLQANQFSHGFIRVSDHTIVNHNFMREDGSFLAKNFYPYIESPSGQPLIMVAIDKQMQRRNLMDMNGDLLLPFYTDYITQREKFYLVSSPESNDGRGLDIYSLEGKKILSNVILAERSTFSNMVVATLTNNKEMLLTNEGIPVTDQTFDNIDLIAIDIQRFPGSTNEYQYLFNVTDKQKGHNLLTDKGKILSPIWSKNRISFKSTSTEPIGIIVDPKNYHQYQINDKGEISSENKSFDVNEQVNRIKSIMGLNESEVLSEKLTKVDTDVDFIYNKYFKKIMKHILDDKPVKASLFKKIETDTSILKDPICIEAHKKNPCKIIISGRSNHYDPIRKIISICISPSAIDHLENCNNYSNALHRLDDEYVPLFKSDLSEYRIKGTINHELVHWIDDTFNKQHIEKFITKNMGDSIKQAQQFKHINAHHIERQAQIHNIEQLYKQYNDQWDQMTFDDMIQKLPSISSFLKQMPNDIKTQWKENIKKRMNREGLLGKKMR